MPYVLSELDDILFPGSEILDVGYGCGFLTNEILIKNPQCRIQGIDVSRTAFEYARNKYPHIQFSLGDICNNGLCGSFDVVVANMVIHNLIDLNGFLSSIKGVLKQTGKVLVVTLHSCFWPVEKLDATKFNYEEWAWHSLEKANYQHPVYYFHRPIESYFNAFSYNGFSVTAKPIYDYEKDGITLKEFPHLLGIILENEPPQTGSFS
ncbi:hypothetical protein FACS1894202_10430 [Clostridia bacterium]|nr:hypothetical protein FACS1894202_10430 [Clostridia bacterium]